MYRFQNSIIYKSHVTEMEKKVSIKIRLSSTFIFCSSNYRHFRNILFCILFWSGVLTHRADSNLNFVEQYILAFEKRCVFQI